MKALSLIGFILALGSQSYAAPAVTYSCVGKNNAGREAVVFEVTFSDHDYEVGYTNQSVTVLKRGWEEQNPPLTLQMVGANKKNNCKTNENGEIYMHGSFEMDPMPDPSEALETSFKIACGKDISMDVKGYCFFQN